MSEVRVNPRAGLRQTAYQIIGVCLLLLVISSVVLFGAKGISDKAPPLEERFFKEDAFLRGKEFLYQNDPEKILSRTRTVAAILTLLTALVVFFAAREMFGTGAAFVALTLLAFDPNLLAHGALITTDVGLACFMFLSIYMFYRCSDWLVGLVVLLQVSLRRAT
jgi:hypothetical protein